VAKAEGGAADQEGALLVCTDVAARGLDIPMVMNVVHYQVAHTVDVYVHRSGRTARIGRAGESLSLITPQEEKQFKMILRTLKKQDVQMLRVNYA